MFKDIIWDFDGTLFDTYPETVNSFRRALKDYGIEETGENILNYLKVSDSFAVSHFKELYDLDDAFIDKFKFCKKNIEAERVRPFPFAAEVCSKIASLGGRNFIVTHRGESTIRFLKHHGMHQYFTEIVTKQHGFKRKPDPEGFLYLIDKHNMDKSSVLIVGDRDCEVLAGKSAGIKVCLYNTNNVPITETPNFYIDSLNKLTEIISVK